MLTHTSLIPAEAVCRRRRVDPGVAGRSSVSRAGSRCTLVEKLSPDHSPLVATLDRFVETWPSKPLWIFAVRVGDKQSCMIRSRPRPRNTVRPADVVAAACVNPILASAGTYRRPPPVETSGDQLQSRSNSSICVQQASPYRTLLAGPTPIDSVDLSYLDAPTARQRVWCGRGAPEVGWKLTAQRHDRTSITSGDLPVIDVPIVQLNAWSCPRIAPFGNFALWRLT